MTTISIRPIPNIPKVIWHLDNDEDPTHNHANSSLNTVSGISTTNHKYLSVEIQDELVSPSSLSMKTSVSNEQLSINTALANNPVIISENAVVPVTPVRELEPEHFLKPSEIVIPLTEDSNIHHAQEDISAQPPSDTGVTETGNNAAEAVANFIHTITEKAIETAAGIYAVADEALKEGAQTKKDNDAANSPIKQASTEPLDTSGVTAPKIQTASSDTTGDSNSEIGIEEANPLFPSSFTTTNDKESESGNVAKSPVIMNSFIDKEYTAPVVTANPRPSLDLGVDTTVDDGVSQSATPYSSAFSSPQLSPKNQKSGPTPIVRGSRLNQLIKQHEEAINKSKEVQISTPR